MTRRIGLAILSVLGLAFVGLFIPVTHIRHTCVICRLYRVKSVYAFVPVTEFHVSDCSRYYRRNVEPSHTHIWEKSICTYWTNLYGMSRGVGCSPGRYPIWTLDPTTQLGVYQHFENPREAKAIFADLTDEKTQGDRLEEDIFTKGHLIVRAMRAWEAAGFPGTWETWWARFYTLLSAHLVLDISELPPRSHY